jgi:hypothetical protein
MFATLGEGLGCVLIKSTLGFRGNPEGRDARSNGGQREQFTSNLGARRTIRVTAGGRQVSKGGLPRGSAMYRPYCKLHVCTMNDCVMN